MYWDKVAKIYNLFVNKSKVTYDEIIEISRNYISKEDLVLELGAGPGTISKDLAKFSGKLIVTDGFKNMVKECRKNLKDIENIVVKQEDIENLSFVDKYVDVVFIGNTLHVLEDPVRALEEIKRVLKDDGILIAPNFVKTESIKSKFLRKALKFSGCPMKRYWTREGYIKFISENGFEPIFIKLIKGNIDVVYIAAKKEKIFN